jgi:PAS domain S-box-containing protein
MKKDYFNWNPVTNPISQNVIIGSITGIMVGINLRPVFSKVYGPDIAWLVTFLALILGFLLGFLSGKERQRLERLKKEKLSLEENLKKIQRALKRSVDRFRLMVEGINEAVYLTTKEGRFIVFNTAISLLSGYKKEQLKNMNLSQIQIKEDSAKLHYKDWVSKGICRYEERWKNKDGHIIFLEVNAKPVEIADQQLVLHVARDIFQRKREDEKRTVREAYLFHQSKLEEIASTHQARFNKITNTITDTVAIVQSLKKEYPDKENKLSEMLSEWQNNMKEMQEISSKYSRDLRSSQEQFELNTILTEELQYLEIFMDIDAVVETWFAPNLPTIKGYGKDFSLAFGLVLKAFMESIKSTRERKLTVSTRYMGKHILIEIESSSAKDFKGHLTKVTNPAFEKDSNINAELGLTICKMFFEHIKSRLSVENKKGGGVTVKIWVPIPEENL